MTPREHIAEVANRLILEHNFRIRLMMGGIGQPLNLRLETELVPLLFRKNIQGPDVEEIRNYINSLYD